MPTLEWIGKDKVVNHHLDVPFKVLEEAYTFGEEESGNKIIQGDNLEALKSLLPQYEGKIKCIYIDPPYNTGNEKWVYNDNVNDPRIKKWLGDVVGKEGEDLSRHDKWLCMMYPRLKLLHRLLAEDGAIFISIDDHEQANLKLICDEIFGPSNFVSNVSWQRTYSQRNDSKGIAAEVEYVLVYGKRNTWEPKRLGRTEKMNAKYKNTDNDPKGAWRNIIASAPGSATHQGMVYAIQNPFTGEYIYPPSGRHWPLQQSQMLNIMNEWCNYELRDLHDTAERGIVCNMDAESVRPDVSGIVLVEPLADSALKAKSRYEQGAWPEFFFTKGGKGTLSRKAYLGKVGGRSVTNLWHFEETGHTDEAARILKAIFNGNVVLETPKPPRLIERILQIATSPDSIILDSFAGSGTTAHAVLNLNKQDGGNRKFILIEMMDYAENITAERVRRVINGYGEGDKAVEGTGGGFEFYHLGLPLLIDNKYLNEDVSEEKIREYIYFTETKEEYVPCLEEPHLLGTHLQASYYFYYEKEQQTTLNREFLAKIQTKSEEYIIYADVNQLSDEEMKTMHISFKKIPRDIKRL